MTGVWMPPLFDLLAPERWVPLFSTAVPRTPSRLPPDNLHLPEYSYGTEPDLWARLTE